MKYPKVEKVWVSTSVCYESELRFDWDNDYHHAVVIRHPGSPKEIAGAFHRMAELVMEYGKYLKHQKDTVNA